jgi:hypothetical protein
VQLLQACVALTCSCCWQWCSFYWQHSILPWSSLRQALRASSSLRKFSTAVSYVQSTKTVLIQVQLHQHTLTSLCNEHLTSAAGASRQLSCHSRCVEYHTQRTTTATKRVNNVSEAPRSIPTCLLFNVEAPIVDLLLWRIWYVTLELMLHSTVLLLCHLTLTHAEATRWLPVEGQGTLSVVLQDNAGCPCANEADCRTSQTMSLSSNVSVRRRTRPMTLTLQQKRQTLPVLLCCCAVCDNEA